MHDFLHDITFLCTMSNGSTCATNSGNTCVLLSTKISIVEKKLCYIMCKKTTYENQVVHKTKKCKIIHFSMINMPYIHMLE